MKQIGQRANVLYEEVIHQYPVTEEELKAMPWTEKYSKYLMFGKHISTVLRVTGTNPKDMAVYFVDRFAHIIGDRFWIANEKPRDVFYYKEGRLGDAKNFYMHLRPLKKVFKQFEFLPDIIPSKIFNRTTVKMILDGKITSQEALWKAYLKSAYHTKQIPWKLFRDYAADTFTERISIWDILSFTKNPAVSLQKWLEYNRKNSAYNENIQWYHDEEAQCVVSDLRDLLFLAAQLGEKVDFSWSPKRIKAEHQRQVLQMNKYEVDNKSDEHLYQLPSTADVTPLVSEKDIFKEGLTMEHCIYRVYYQRIKNKEYIAFSLHKDDPARKSTAGVIVESNGDLRIEQIRAYRNGQCEEEDFDIMEDYLKKYHDEITKVLNKPKSLKVTMWHERQPIVLPF